MTETQRDAALPPEMPDKGQRTGRHRWGCGCLLLLALGLYFAVSYPSYKAYKEREPKQREFSLRGLFDGGPGETPESAVIDAGVKHKDAIPLLVQPVYGCATLDAYTLVTRTLYDSGDYKLVPGASSTDAHAQNAQCRAMPEGAEVDVEELRLALFAAKVRIRGEDKAWWTPCSGLRAKEENAVQPKDKDTQF